MLFDFSRFGSPPARTDRHRLAGTVTVDGQPASRLVCVFDRLTMALIASKWSIPTTGVWEIAGLPEYPKKRLFVASFDNAGNFNAEIADYITQVTTSGDVPVSYIPCYPQAHSADYVKATTFYSGQYSPWFATDPALPLNGNGVNTTWVSSDGGNVNQKLNIDFGVARLIKRLYLENFHSLGTLTEAGIANFSVYGTNSATAFANLTYANTDDLTLLGTFQARPHSSLDASDPQYFLLNNNTAFRYAVIRIADCHGHALRMGIVHLAFQIEY